MHIPKTEGSSEAIDCFKSHGDSLYVITARPLTSLAVSHKWVQTQYGDVFEEIYFVHQLEGRTKDLKAQKCKQYGIDAMVEDSHANATACADGGRTSFLLRYPWNQVPGNNDTILPVGHWHHGYHNGWQEIIAWRLEQARLALEKEYPITKPLGN